MQRYSTRNTGAYPPSNAFSNRLVSKLKKNESFFFIKKREKYLLTGKNTEILYFSRFGKKLEEYKTWLVVGAALRGIMQGCCDGRDHARGGGGDTAWGISL